MGRGPVTITVTHRVAPDRATQFSVSAKALVSAASRSRGYLGGGVIGSAESGEHWQIFVRFDSEAAATRWETSPGSVRWRTHLARFARQTDVRRSFGPPMLPDGQPCLVNAPRRPAPPPPPAQPAGPPPKWKMALVTLAAVFPPVLLFNLTLIPALRDLSVVLRTLALCVGVTAVVTWIMMPKLNRLLKPWLYPGDRKAARRKAARRKAPDRREVGTSTGRHATGRHATGRHATSDRPPAVKRGTTSGRRRRNSGRFEPPPVDDTASLLDQNSLRLLDELAKAPTVLTPGLPGAGPRPPSPDQFPSRR